MVCLQVGQPQDTLHVPSLQVPGCSLCANAPKEKEFGESPKPLHLGLVAGGTGLSPLLQILRLAVESPWEIGGKGGINATLMYSVQTKVVISGMIVTMSVAWWKLKNCLNTKSPASLSL